MTIASKENIWS